MFLARLGCERGHTFVDVGFDAHGLFLKDQMVAFNFADGHEVLENLNCHHESLAHIVGGVCRGEK